MPFLVLQNVTARNVNGESNNHEPGTVLSDWEVEEHVHQKILEGSEWFRARFEPLTEREAEQHRITATSLEQPHKLDLGGGQVAIIAPPFPDYVGLHPTEVVARLKSGPVGVAQAARQYESAGMRRDMIIGFIHPAEREPFLGFNNMDVTAIQDKLELLSEAQIADAKVYEAAHANRPAIIDFEKESVAA